jgi:hypothetical protein
MAKGARLVQENGKQQLKAARSKIYGREAASRPRIYVLEKFGVNRRDIITLGGIHLHHQRDHFGNQTD